MKNLFFLSCLIFGIGITDTSHAAFFNYGFETGDFEGWETFGDVSVVDSSYGVNPYNGDYQAILTTNNPASSEELRSFLGMPHESWDAFFSPIPQAQENIEAASAIKIVRSTTYDDFRLRFLTNGNPFDPFGSSGGLGLVGYLQDSNNWAIELWTSDEPATWELWNWESSLTPFTYAQTPWRESVVISYNLPRFVEDEHTLFFVIADIGPDLQGHGLLIDAGNPVPIPGTAWLLGSSFLGFLGLRRRFHKR